MALPALKHGPKIPSLTLVCFLGLFLGAGFCVGLIFFSIYPEKFSFPGARGAVIDPFRRGLREYDALFAKNRPDEDPDLFIRALDRLEKNSMGVESWLSLLKRRRHLAQTDGRFLGAYQKKALEAAAAFPHSESLAALAAESLLAPGVPEDSPLSAETAARFRDLGSRLRDPQFRSLVLALHVLAGDLRDPAAAAGVPGLEGLFSQALLSPIPGRVSEGLRVDAAILRVLKDDAPGAAVHVNSLLSPGNSGGAVTEGALRFAAEFFYDFGSPLRAAELFTLFSDESSMARTADALWLAGHHEGARNIWTVLVSPPLDSRTASPGAGGGAVKNRSLYNLAASAENSREALIRLEELFARGQGGESPWYGNPAGAEGAFIYGIIRYTRLLDTTRALAILETGALGSHPLLDLELLRRRQETLPADRNLAETWLLLGRHAGDEGLHEWAAWYFDSRRQYGELALLLRSAERQGFRGPWLELHKSLILMRESRLAEAAAGFEALASDPAAGAFWQIPANLALIMESRRSPSAALGYYEIASGGVRNRAAASNIQFRISRCLRLLGQERESRRVLEYALDLDPENLNARLELRRMDGRQVF